MPDTPYWTNEVLDVAHVDQLSSDACKFIGMDPSYTGNAEFCNWLKPFSHMTASDAFLEINGFENDVVGFEDFGYFTPVSGTPPCLPNTYTD
eukprot:9958276-Karenia_brevis.AAC.1